MASSEDLADGEPPVIDPYEVLEIDRSASADQVKSAYRKAALRNHPDKVPEDRKSEANEKFQSIALAYAILSDPARRKRYDETGSTAESIVDADGFSWTDFYREQYRDAVSEDAIAKFAKKYRGSDEERDDLLIAYEKYKGKMGKVYESVMLSDPLEDEQRFRAILDQAIAEGDVPGFAAYTKESKASREKRLNEAKGEAKEAEEHAKFLGVHDKLFSKKKGKKSKDDAEADLGALIRKNQEKRGSSFLDNLAEKYGAKPKPKGKGGKKRALEEDDEDEPSEEAFQAAAARLKKRK